MGSRTGLEMLHQAAKIAMQDDCLTATESKTEQSQLERTDKHRRCAAEASYDATEQALHRVTERPVLGCVAKPPPCPG